jgi:hypothetical protein
MAHDPVEQPESPEDEPDYARGKDEPEEHLEDERKGRFSTGEEELPEADPEKQHHGRFSEGEEELPESDPEKHERRRFSEGEDSLPPDVKP